MLYIFITISDELSITYLTYLILWNVAYISSDNIIPFYLHALMLIILCIFLLMLRDEEMCFRSKPHKLQHFISKHFSAINFSKSKTIF